MMMIVQMMIMTTEVLVESRISSYHIQCKADDDDPEDDDDGDNDDICSLYHTNQPHHDHPSCDTIWQNYS